VEGLKCRYAKFYLSRINIRGGIYDIFSERSTDSLVSHFLRTFQGLDSRFSRTSGLELSW
jgi:hypothetical protein